jgi:hypothetical protein
MATIQIWLALRSSWSRSVSTRNPAARWIAVIRWDAYASNKNAEVYRQVIPLINAAARNAVLLVVTDPPDPLTYLTRTRRP